MTKNAKATARNVQNRLTETIRALDGVSAIYPAHGAIRAEAERLWKVLGSQGEARAASEEGYVDIADDRVTARIGVSSTASAPQVARAAAALIRKNVPGVSVSVTVVRILED